MHSVIGRNLVGKTLPRLGTSKTDCKPPVHGTAVLIEGSYLYNVKRTQVGLSVFTTDVPREWCFSEVLKFDLCSET